MSGSVRNACVAVCLAVMSMLAMSSPAGAHPGHAHPGLDGRFPGQPDLLRVGATTYRFLPAQNEYEVREPGRPTTYVHNHPGDTLTAMSEGEGSELPQKEMEPACRTSGNRIVAVHAFPEKPGSQSVAV